VNPVHHYKMKVGLLKEGDAADFIIVKDLEKFKVLQTYIDGELVAENGESKVKSQKSKIINNFSCNKKKVEDINVPLTIQSSFFIIEALDGQLITNKKEWRPSIINNL